MHHKIIVTRRYSSGHLGLVILETSGVSRPVNTGLNSPRLCYHPVYPSTRETTRASNTRMSDPMHVAIWLQQTFVHPTTRSEEIEPPICPALQRDNPAKKCQPLSGPRNLPLCYYNKDSPTSVPLLQPESFERNKDRRRCSSQPFNSQWLAVSVLFNAPKTFDNGRRWWDIEEPGREKDADNESVYKICPGLPVLSLSTLHKYVLKFILRS